MGANNTPKTSPRRPNTPPEATQEPLKSSAKPSKGHTNRFSTLAQSVRDRQEFKNKTEKLEEKIKALEADLKNEEDNSQAENQEKDVQQNATEEKNDELEKMRNEFGALGGAGHFWGNDAWKNFGGERDTMGEKGETLKIAGLRRSAPVRAGLRRSAPVRAGLRRSKKFFFR